MSLSKRSLICYLETLKIKYDELTLTAVNQAYKNLALITHPDKRGSDTKEDMQRLNEARDNILKFLKGPQVSLPNDDPPAPRNSEFSDIINELMNAFSALKTVVNPHFKTPQDSGKRRSVNQAGNYVYVLGQLGDTVWSSRSSILPLFTTDKGLHDLFNVIVVPRLCTDCIGILNDEKVNNWKDFVKSVRDRYNLQQWMNGLNFIEFHLHLDCTLRNDAHKLQKSQKDDVIGLWKFINEKIKSDSFRINGYIKLSPLNGEESKVFYVYRKEDLKRAVDDFSYGTVEVNISVLDEVRPF